MILKSLKVGAIAMLLSATANASVIITESLIGAGEDGGVRVGVTVTNNGADDISAFFIGTNSPMEEPDFQISSAGADETYSIWNAGLYNKSMWDQGRIDVDTRSGQYRSLTLSDYGSWNSLFGTYEYVFAFFDDIEMYWGDYDAIAAGETREGFFFEAGSLGSPFLAIYADGTSFSGETLHANTEVSVPEPGSLLLMLAGLFGLALVRSRAA